MSQTCIEKMRRADIAAVREIEREVNLSSWTEGDYEEELERPDSVCLVVKKDGRVVGFALARLITMSKTPAEIYEAELLNIAIRKEFQRSATGSKLLESLTENLRSKNTIRIWLEVRQSNHPALDFYRKHGFHEKFRRSGYYSLPHEDAIVMSREIGVENVKEK